MVELVTCAVWWLHALSNILLQVPSFPRLTSNCSWSAVLPVSDSGSTLHSSSNLDANSEHGIVVCAENRASSRASYTNRYCSYKQQVGHRTQTGTAPTNKKGIVHKLVLICTKSNICSKKLQCTASVQLLFL